MAFANEEDVMNCIEKLVRGLWKDCLGIEVESEFPRMTYAKAMQCFGSDKPDVRFGMEVCKPCLLRRANNVDF
jgi:aspartyl-tRNA synthetase